MRRGYCLLMVLVMGLVIGCGAMTSDLELEAPAGAPKSPEVGEAASAAPQGGEREEQPAKRGSLSKAEIRQVIRGALPSIQACYERGQAKNRELAGRVVVRFRIQLDGSVIKRSGAGNRGAEGAEAQDDATSSGDGPTSTARILSSELDSREVESCILSVVTGLEFPEPRDGGEVVVSYPLLFAPAARPRSKLTTFTLENGLEVVLLPDRTSHQVAVAVTYKVGQRDNPPGYGGMAHLMEHLMFQKTRNIGEGGVFRTLDRLGAVERQGSTHLDHTVYWEVVPSHQLGAALWMESERMAYMLEGLDQETLDRQRRVVLRENRERDQTTISRILRSVAKTRLYPSEHPYFDAGDDPADLEAIELGHVRWFFQRYYRPDNARLAIVGDIDPPVARALVERYFGSIRSHPAPTKSAERNLPPITKTERRVTYGWGEKAAHLILQWRAPAHLAAGDVELDLIGRVLAGYPQSRLNNALVAELGTAKTVSASQWQRELESVFQIYVELDGGRSAMQKSLERIDAELQKLAANPPTEEEVERARRRRWESLILESESLASTAQRLSRWSAAEREAHPLLLDELLARDEGVTPVKLQQAAARYLPTGSRLVLFVNHWHYSGRSGGIVADEVRP